MIIHFKGKATLYKFDFDTSIDKFKLFMYVNISIKRERDKISEGVKIIKSKLKETICFYNTKIYRDMLTDWVIEYLFIRPQNLHRKFNLSFVSAGKIVSLPLEHYR